MQRKVSGFLLGILVMLLSGCGSWDEVNLSVSQMYDDMGIERGALHTKLFLSENEVEQLLQNGENGMEQVVPLMTVEGKKCRLSLVYQGRGDESRLREIQCRFDREAEGSTAEELWETVYAMIDTMDQKWGGYAFQDDFSSSEEPDFEQSFERTKQWDVDGTVYGLTYAHKSEEGAEEDIIILTKS